MAAALLLCGFFAPHAKLPTLPANSLKVPIVRQATDYSCGAAAMLGVLQYWGKWEDPESSLYADLKTTPKDGTDARSMVAFAQKLGLDASMTEKNTLDDLRLALNQGVTTILDIQAWSGEDPAPDWEQTWEEGHYVVLVGMDKTHAYFMDPVIGTSYTYLTLDELLARWHDYENRDGKVWKHYQLAIYIRGAKAIPTFPAPLTKTE
jgi:uncharacterized protein